jgi:hypothetical protein
LIRAAGVGIGNLLPTIAQRAGRFILARFLAVPCQDKPAKGNPTNANISDARMNRFMVPFLKLIRSLSHENRRMQ